VPMSLASAPRKTQSPPSGNSGAAVVMLSSAGSIKLWRWRARREAILRVSRTAAQKKTSQMIRGFGG
jgi:hypothetical protein